MGHRRLVSGRLARRTVTQVCTRTGLEFALLGCVRRGAKIARYRGTDRDRRRDTKAKRGDCSMHRKALCATSLRANKIFRLGECVGPESCGPGLAGIKHSPSRTHCLILFGQLHDLPATTCVLCCQAERVRGHVRGVPPQSCRCLRQGAQPACRVQAVLSKCTSLVAM